MKSKGNTMKYVGILLMAVLIAGCSTNRLKDTLFYSTAIYNQQYDDYLVVARRDDLTEPEKQILRVKRKALTELESKIKILKKVVISGTMPPDDIEAEILRLTKKLTGGS